MIRYRHRNCAKAFQPATFAYDLPPASLFKEMFEQGENLITFPFGMTLLHPKEKNYVKSVGREHALRDVKPSTFTLDQINLGESKQIFYLSKAFGTKCVQIIVTTNLNQYSDARLDFVTIKSY